MPIHRNIGRILLVRNDRMGDMLMSLPAVHAVRKKFPEAEITLLVRRGLEPLVEGHPDIDRVLAIDEKDTGWRATLRWSGRLRGRRFDAAVVLNPSRMFHVASFLAGIRVRAGYRRKWGFLLTNSIPDTKTARRKHESEFNLELVRLLGVPESEPVLRLPRRPDAEREAARLLALAGLRAGEKPVALHPWTSNPVKSWPLESFAQLAELLQRRRAVVVIGGEEVLAAAAGWRALAPAGALDLVGKVPLYVLPDLLRLCGGLVSNDSGPVHVAAAVGTPTVVVAPESHGPLLARWGPLGGNHRILLSPTVEQVADACAF